MTTEQRQFDVGRLLCGRFRDYLKSLRFSGHNIEWLEGSGILSRIFTIRGDKQALSKLSDAVRAWGG